MFHSCKKIFETKLYLKQKNAEILKIDFTVSDFWWIKKILYNIIYYI